MARMGADGIRRMANQLSRDFQRLLSDSMTSLKCFQGLFSDLIQSVHFDSSPLVAEPQ